MKIAVAQTRPIKGDIPANIKAHKKLVDLAVSFQAHALFFPELSLTGYEPALAKNLATNQDDKIFDDFQQISNKNNITIGLGMPIRTSQGIEIGMIVLQPNARRQTYSKQILHADELPYFVNGKSQAILIVDGKQIAPAICYESLHLDHAEKARHLGAEVYVASVAKSKTGIAKAMNHYPTVAKTYSMPVLMSNCIGYCDNFQSVGQSAVWTKRGELAGQLDDQREGLLIFDTETEEVIAQMMEN